jgi:tetratricopeptide (TPR) repeat protein
VAETTTPRIEELRRRIHKDPASIAFAALAEEYRRAGALHDAVRTCRAGLTHHREYASARATLGRSLLELGDLDEAFAELTAVLKAAPENLAALRGLAEIHRRREQWVQALERYRAALALAPQDADLQQAVVDLECAVPLQSPGNGLPSEESPKADFSTMPPPDPAAPEPVAVEPDPAEPVCARLESWLDVILADRAERQ